VNTELPYQTIAVTFIGGLAMFLYGISTMSDGMKKLSGEHIRSLMTALTSNRFFGSVCRRICHHGHSVEQCDHGHAGQSGAGPVDHLHQSMGVILGAEIGTPPSRPSLLPSD
jgi:phosphate:Na+ symporter